MVFLLSIALNPLLRGVQRRRSLGAYPHVCPARDTGGEDPWTWGERMAWVPSPSCPLRTVLNPPKSSVHFHGSRNLPSSPPEGNGVHVWGEERMQNAPNEPFLGPVQRGE